MKELDIKTVTVEDKEYLVKLREGFVGTFEVSFVVFKLITKEHPEFLYDEINFPIKDKTELEEVIELFTKTKEVLEYFVLARKMTEAGEVFLEEVLEVPVKERTSKLHLIYYQNNAGVVNELSYYF